MNRSTNLNHVKIPNISTAYSSILNLYTANPVLNSKNHPVFHTGRLFIRNVDAIPWVTYMVDARRLDSLEISRQRAAASPEITVGMVGVRRVVREAGVVGLELRLKARMHPGALARCLFSFKVEAG